MKELIEDCLEFLLTTIGGVFILSILIVLILLSLFWPQAETEPLPWIGVVGKEIDSRAIQKHRLPFSKGVLVERVFSNSPADYGNLTPGDIIIKFNESIVLSQAQLRDLIFDMDPEEKVRMTVYRDGSYYNVRLRLAAKPTDRSLPAQAATMWAAAAGRPKTVTTSPAPSPPITANASLPHTYRGVCSNCHVIVSNAQANQPDTQLVAALRQRPGVSNLPGAGWQQFSPQNLPGAIRTTPLEEFTWAGISMETFDRANAAALGLPPNVTGVQVDDVLRGSRGAWGGVLRRDLIREVNGMAVYDVDSFANLVTAYQLTGGVMLVNRAGRSMYVTVPEM